jgi:hypothetical protein
MNCEVGVARLVFVVIGGCRLGTGCECQRWPAHSIQAEAQPRHGLNVVLHCFNKRADMMKRGFCLQAHVSADIATAAAAATTVTTVDVVVRYRVRYNLRIYVFTLTTGAQDTPPSKLHAVVQLQDNVMPCSTCKASAALTLLQPSHPPDAGHMRLNDSENG